MRSSGLLISLEGPEGSGKSSLARWLVRWLRRRGHRVEFVRDPGSTALGRSLRNVLLHTSASLTPVMEAALFIGGRVQLVEERIVPALRQGRVVVCDRFHDSTIAYQGFGGGVRVRWLDELGRRALHGVMPSLTVLLDISTARGFARLHRKRDRMERKARAFHRRVRAGFLRLAQREPRRFVVIDAQQSPSAVRRQLAGVLTRRLV